MKLNNFVWYNLPESEVLQNTGSSIAHGLSSEDVASRKDKFGANTITQKKTAGPLILFLQQFNQPLVYILVAATIITAALKEWIDSSVIFGVVLVNAIIGFIQESKARKAIDSLAKSMTSEATVIRDGKKQRIRAAELTIGDTVLLQSRRQSTCRSQTTPVA
jgi:cation-transporting ATPase F